MYSDELIAFFTKVTSDPILQQQLYLTHEISDVAKIARNLGFGVTASEILKAQAGRSLTIRKEDPNDLEELVAGRRPKTGAQWGRAGKGYLDRPGFWLFDLHLSESLSPFQPEISAFLSRAKKNEELKTRLFAAKSFTEVACIARENGYALLTSVTFLEYLAERILELNDEEAERVAFGAGLQVP